MEKNTQIQYLTGTCKKCNKGIRLSLASSAYSFICPFCGSLYKCYNGELILTNQKANIPEKDFDIPLGTIGTIKGIRYQVIAYLNKKENGTIYYWHEYVLFNPVYGLAYLSQYDGHWTYLVETSSIPTVKGRVASQDGLSYDLFSKYKSKINSASGEFVYRFDVSEMPIIEEFVRPGFLLSKEVTDDVVTWYKGEYIVPKEIKEGFNLKSVPEAKGVGMIQPFMGKFKEEAFSRILVFILIFWSLAQFYFLMASKEEIVFDQSFFIVDSLNRKEIHSKTFDLNYGTCNAEIKIRTNISNNWFYSNATLVNEKTGDIYDVGLEAEYYYGYTDGESWSEGSSWVSKVVSQVPEGKYYMILTPEKPSDLTSVNATVTVTRDVFVISNGLIVLVLLGVYPAYYFYRKNKLEKERWYNSNFSPYDND